MPTFWLVSLHTLLKQAGGRNTYDDFDTDNAGWAISGFDSAVERMIGQTGTDDALLCFTGRGNFRYSILPTYNQPAR